MNRCAVKPEHVCAAGCALWHLPRVARLGTWMLTARTKCALRRCLQTCALVSRWSEAQVTAGARVAHARALSQSHVHAQATRSSQCPVAVSQSQRAHSSASCA